MSNFTSIEEILDDPSPIVALRCRFLQVTYPRNFDAAMEVFGPRKVVRAPLALRPWYYVVRMLIYPPEERHRRPLENYTMLRMEANLEWPMLEISDRYGPPRFKLGFNLADGGASRSLSGPALNLLLVRAFINPSWLFVNWELTEVSFTGLSNGPRYLQLALRCRIKRGQPVAGGVIKADRIELRVDRALGLVTARVAYLNGYVVERTRVVGISRFERG